MKFYKKIGFWVLLLLCVLIAFLVIKSLYSSVGVRTVPVQRQDFEVTVTATATGTIKSDEEVKVSAQRAGMVSTLYVVEGDTVEKGSPIAELDTGEASISLKLARATLQRTKAALDEALAAYEPLKAEVEANIQKADATLRDAKDNVERFGELLEKGYISKSELDKAKRDYEIARANMDVALAGRGQLKARAEEITARKAAVREAGESLALAELNNEYSFLKASISGIVTSVPVKVGETVMKGALVATMIAMESLYIESFVDEADVDKVRTGQEVRITMDAYPEETFQGVVYMISPVVTGGRLEARTFEVRTRFNDKDLLLKSGMSADVEIVVDSVKDALVVPAQAVMEREGKQFIYLNDDSRARLREVTTGLSSWTSTQVVSGLKEGDEVIVTTDVPGLKEGKRVEAEPL
jgi:HlyD family secretion protein